MKMAYKTISFFAVLGLLFAVAGPSAQAAAVNPQCLVLDTKLQAITAGLATKEKPLSQLRVKNTYNNGQSPVVLKSKILSAQKVTDKEVKTAFKKLHLKAKTPAQKAAMVAYEAEFAAALKAFRAESETARAAYETGFNDLVNAHRAAVDSQLVALKKRFETANASAKSSCQKTNNIDKSIIFFKSEVTLAQDSYLGSPNVGTKDIQASLKVVADTHKAASDKAAKTFDQSLQISNAKLKTALPNTKYIFE